MFSDNAPNTAPLGGYHFDYNFLSLDDNITPNPPFGPNAVFKAQPFFIDTANNNFRLMDCSPAVNWGNNMALDSLNITTDLDSNPRIRFGTVDLGPYETQDSCFIVRSKEPIRSGLTAVLAPNPSLPGCQLNIQVSTEKKSSISWVIWDSYGRSIKIGEAKFVDQELFSVVAPEVPGFYFLELCTALHSVWVKFVVAH
jgi:hypothetical protein